MFQHAKPFSGFAVDDLQQAKRFYGETLGLDVSDAPMGTLQITLGGDTRVLVYEKPDYQPATFTILNFPVDDVDDAVSELAERGVRFEVYREGPLRTDDRGVHRGDGPTIAWFKDPAGNWLSILEPESNGG